MVKSKWSSAINDKSMITIALREIKFSFFFFGLRGLSFRNSDEYKVRNTVERWIDKGVPKRCGVPRWMWELIYKLFKEIDRLRDLNGGETALSQSHGVMIQHKLVTTRKSLQDAICTLRKYQKEERLVFKPATTYAMVKV